METNMSELPHIRYNPLRYEWVLVSPNRMQRPWEGAQETARPAAREGPIFDPQNPLCPGVRRPNGITTPYYTETCVFDNDFPALVKDASADDNYSTDPLFQSRSAQGVCRVMCYHPHSNTYLTTMTDTEVIAVIEEWKRQTQELGIRYQWVQIFENRGEMMGCSNPHPHCQIWASNFMPHIADRENFTQSEYFFKYDRPMLMEYMSRELETGKRVVFCNKQWVVVVPFWAVWPFETMILPKVHVRRITDLDDDQVAYLAHTIKTLIRIYDNLFKCEFPFSMGWHGAPTGPSNINKPMNHWTFHGEYYPPLLRSATVRKFMVGYEMLAASQRDLTPERAAALLRESRMGLR